MGALVGLLTVCLAFPFVLGLSWAVLVFLSD